MRVAGGAIPYTTVHGTEVRSHARERASLNDVIHEQAVAMTQGQPARYEGWQGGVHCGDMCTSYGGERQLQRHERLESEPLSLVTLATRVPRSAEADQDRACWPDYACLGCAHGEPFQPDLPTGGHKAYQDDDGQCCPDLACCFRNPQGGAHNPTRCDTPKLKTLMMGEMVWPHVCVLDAKRVAEVLAKKQQQRK